MLFFYKNLISFFPHKKTYTFRRNMNLENADTLEKIVVFCDVKDLRVLMRVRKQIREIVMGSDRWKHELFKLCAPVNKFEMNLEDVADLLKYTNVSEIFKLFASIKLIKNPFATSIIVHSRDWYYLYVMEIMLTKFQKEQLNLLYLFENFEDIKKLCKICGFGSSPIKSKIYYDWYQLIPAIRWRLEISSVWKSKDRDTILQSIHFNISDYDSLNACNILVITNNRMENIPKLQHFHYQFAFHDISFDFCLCSSNGKIQYNLSPLNFRKKLSKISWKLNVDFTTFSEIIRIVLGNDNRSAKQINNFMRHKLLPK